MTGDQGYQVMITHTRDHETRIDVLNNVGEAEADELLRSWQCSSRRKSKGVLVTTADTQERYFTPWRDIQAVRIQPQIEVIR
jgi:hypothetical protein